MDRNKFVEALKEQGYIYEVEDTGNCVIVKNKHFGTITQISNEAIENNDLQSLVLLTHQGKNIEHITRVTGYFSKINSWNKGKIAELKDRYRTGI
ncbi:MAG TPA: anaerobic ribonucleoside-triphosphate reductase [Candidatus Ratteibacteria bacterium]|jgi:uncharacterized protein YbgA (DUF1722 family)|nr:anaerobic ribonucleoside-triphosphate reductase [Candidatus Ratteibacteria bacterium]